MGISSVAPCERPTTLLLLANEKTNLDFTNSYPGRNSKGWTVFHYACYFWEVCENTTECLQYLVDDHRCHPDLINKKTTEGRTALTNAVSMHDFQAVKILLNYQGIEFNPEDRTENSPLCIAERAMNDNCLSESHKKSRKEILDLLKEKASIIELCEACKRGEDTTIKEILSKGEVDVNGTDTHGYPPLFNAVINNHPSTLKLLLENSDVRLDFVDHQFNNWTALHWACFGSDDNKCTECVEILVNDSRCNSDLVNSKNTKGDTPI